MAKLVKDMNEIIGGNGGNWAYFAKNKVAIGEFIRANKLAPATVAGQKAVAATAASTLFDLGIRGGIRVPHLHFDDNIYLLDDKQWTTLSKGIVADFSTKLSKAKSISFDDAMVIGSMT